VTISTLNTTQSDRLNASKETINNLNTKNKNLNNKTLSTNRYTALTSLSKIDNLNNNIDNINNFDGKNMKKNQDVIYTVFFLKFAYFCKDFLKK
jgi:hypothetical protein